MLIFDQLFKTLGINSGLDEKQWDVDPREIKPQAEIKPTEPQGLLGPLQSRVGRFLQGDTGFPNPFEGLPKPQLPEPGITSEGTITKNYTPVVSEAGYLATNLVDLIGGGVQDFLTTAGEGLQEWSEGYPLFRQTEMGGYLPQVTQTGKKNIETALGAAPIGGVAKRTIGEGIDAVGGLFRQLEPPSPGTAGMLYLAKPKQAEKYEELAASGLSDVQIFNQYKAQRHPKTGEWWEEVDPRLLKQKPQSEWSIGNKLAIEEAKNLPISVVPSGEGEFAAQIAYVDTPTRFGQIRRWGATEEEARSNAIQAAAEASGMYDPNPMEYQRGEDWLDTNVSNIYQFPGVLGQGGRTPQLGDIRLKVSPKQPTPTQGLWGRTENPVIGQFRPSESDYRAAEILTMSKGRKMSRSPDKETFTHELQHAGDIEDPRLSYGFSTSNAPDMWENYIKPELSRIDGGGEERYPGQFDDLKDAARAVFNNGRDLNSLYYLNPSEGRARNQEFRAMQKKSEDIGLPFTTPYEGGKFPGGLLESAPPEQWLPDRLYIDYWRHAETRGLDRPPVATSEKSSLPRIEAEKSEATGLFSKMEEEILNMPQEKMTTLQFRNYLENKGVKRNEITESGILGQIADEDNRVTKSRALNFLRERDVPKIDEVYMGEMPEDLFDPADWRIDPDNAQVVPMEQGQLDDMIETALDDQLGGGQWNGTRENARDYVRLLNEYDPDTYPLDDPNDNWADAFVNTVVFEGIRSNDIPPSIYDDIKTIIGEREAAVYDDMAEYTWTVGDSAGHQEFTVTGNMDQGFTITNANTGEWISDAPTIEEANIQLRVIGREVSQDLSERSAAATTMFSEWTPDNMNLGTYEEETIYLPRLSKEAREYTGPHWDSPDVGLHLRTSIEELDNGADTLFVLENQSDLHQRGRKYGYDDSTPEQRKAKVAKADQNLKDAERKAAPLGIEFANKAEAGDFPPETLKNLDDLLDQYYRLGAGISPNDFSQSVRRRKIANVITETYIRNQNFMPTRKAILDAVINTVDKDPNLQKYLSAFKAEKEAAELSDIVRKRPPRALLEGDQVIETGFNRAVMKAITEDKDGISWATAEMQKNLYPNAKSDTLYENQYDKKMVSYAKKLATKYNTKIEMVGSKMAKPPVKGKEPEYYQVHYLPFTKEMKAELKKKGMPLYSGAPAAGLLAGEEDAGENQQKGLLGM